MQSVFGANSRRQPLSQTAMLLSAVLIGGSLTGCSSLSEAIKESQAKAAAVKADEAKTVVVAAKPVEQKLPDIPKKIEDCLGTKADLTGKTADAKVTALILADKTKAKCVASFFKWYRERQLAAAKSAPAPDGHPKTEKKGKQAATWE